MGKKSTRPKNEEAGLREAKPAGGRRGQGEDFERPAWPVRSSCQPEMFAAM